MNLFAQTDLPAVPAEALKWTLIVFLALLFTAIAITTLVLNLRSAREKKRVSIDEQPVEVRKAAKRFNHELAENRHGDVTRRLDGHDREISDIRAVISHGLPEMERRLNASGEARSSAIHERINEILEKVSELKGKVNS